MGTATTQIIISGKDQLSSVVANAGRRLGTEMQAAQRNVGNLSNAMASLAGLAGGLSFAQFGKAIFDAGIAADSLQRSLVAIAGSQASAADYVSYLRNESDRLGQSFYDLAPAFKSIAAAARGTALEGEPVRKVFSAIIEASTALGMSTADTEGSLRALGQMISKGNVQAEELRGQLGERLPGAFSLAAKAMGVGTAELNKMLEQGQVLATDLLPKLADEIHKAYGAAAQTSALESAQAAVNRMSEEWTDLKNNMFHSETAVSGINLITEALNGMNAMISQVQQGKAQYIWEGLHMEAMDPSKYRGKVNREMVMPAYVPPGGPTSAAVGKTSTSTAAKEAKAREQAYAKMITDGQKASIALVEYWKNYEDARISALVAGVEAHSQAEAKNLELVTEFSEKYRAAVLGETEFKLAQISIQAQAYHAAGVDEVALAQWVAQEKLNLSEEWRDGAIRGWRNYAEEAGNTAQSVESVVGTTLHGLEDMTAEFFKTGEIGWRDFVNTVNAEIGRLAFKDMVGQMYSFLGDAMGGGKSSSGGSNWLGTALNMGMSALGSYFGGGSSVAAGSAGGGFIYAGEMSSFFSRNAKGGVYDSPSLSAFSNGVYDTPQVFAFAKGGIFAEAGPEAIMPLARGADGSLGVKARGAEDKTEGLLREIAQTLRNQKVPKTVVAFDKKTLANELAGSEGEQLIFQHIRRNPGAVRRMLGLS
jgi:tape measure domain-containing protein